MLVVRKSTPIKIDGDLGEWSEKSRIWCFPDYDLREKFSVGVTACWDTEALYLALNWKDVDGLHNEVDPAVEPQNGWKADALQLRFSTLDQTTWVTTWMFTPKKQPVLLVDVWKDRVNPKSGLESRMLTAAQGETQLGEGVEMAYRGDQDQKDFTQEIRIPWKLLFRKVPALEVEATFKMGMEFIWGGPDGRSKPVNRFADNVQAGETTRQFFWSAQKIWGEATLVDKPPAEARVYRLQAEEKSANVGVPIRLVIPSGATSLTVVIENESGQRIRNLVADHPVSAPSTEVYWDGLSDEGKPVMPGSFRARGLTHGALRVSYEGSYYNPGNPPWATVDGTGGWGGDHTNPSAVAADESGIFLGWPYAEGGFGTIGLSPEGNKVWGEHTGASFLALCGTDVIAAVSDVMGDGEFQLSRFDRVTGKGKPFMRPGGALPFPASLSQLFGKEMTGKITALVAGNDRIFLSLSEGKVCELSSDEAVPVAEYAVNASSLAWHPKLGLLGIVEGRLCRMEKGRTLVIDAPGLKSPGALAVRADGLVAIWDGERNQVHLYRVSKDAKTALPAGMVGKSGGRAIRGRFDPDGLREVSALAFGPHGNLWIVENMPFPRRISSWDESGRLVKSYIGPAAYSGSGSFLDPESPDLAYMGPLQMRRSSDGKWDLDRILWVPDRKQDECFEWSYRDFAIPYLFRPPGDPLKRRWVFFAGRYPFLPRVFYVEEGNAFKPAAAVVLAGHVSGRLDGKGVVEVQPCGEFAGLNAYDLLFWCDENGDGKVQRIECQVAPAKKPAEIGTAGQAAFPLTVGWAGRPDPKDFSFFTIDAKSVSQFQPESFTKSGVPRFSPKTVIKRDWPVNGEVVPLADGKTALLLDTKKGGKRPSVISAINREDGSLLWSYPNPYPGVHGSHEAPMASPGLVIGPLFISGVVEEGNGDGYFLVRGNSGQDFLFTLDGLLVASLFKDARSPGASFLPKSEAELKEKNLMDYTDGFEPFMGSFGRQKDGKIRLTMATAGQAVMVASLEGLDTVRRVPPVEVTVTKEILAAAASPQKIDAKDADVKKTMIAKLQKPLDLGRGEDWKGLPAISIQREGAAEKADVRLAHDGKTLFVEFDVTDSSPWRNKGNDYRTLFKTGDAADLIFGPEGPRANPGDKDVRILFANREGKPAAVVMCPVDRKAPKNERFVYESPVGRKVFDRVRLAPEIQTIVEQTRSGYLLRAAIPLDLLHVSNPPVGTWAADFGILLSDEEGTKNVARRYWSNQKTNLVSDLPSEAWFSPATSGEVTFGK